MAGGKKAPKTKAEAVGAIESAIDESAPVDPALTEAMERAALAEEAGDTSEELAPPPGAGEEGGPGSESTPVGDEPAPPAVPDIEAALDAAPVFPTGPLADIYNAGHPVLVEYAGHGYRLGEDAVTSVPAPVADHVVGPAYSESGTHSGRGCVRVSIEATAPEFDAQVAKARRLWERHVERNPRLLEKAGP